MNRTLLARTKSEFYDDFRHTARRGGIEDEVIERNIAQSIHEAQSLLDGKCPKCGAPSARYIDRTYQAGPSRVPGAWVMYRCSTAPPPGTRRPDGVCDFMTDLKEGDEAN
jgi:hypothetical protein